LIMAAEQATTIFGGTPDIAGAGRSGGSAIGDLFAGFAAQSKAAGDLIEQQNYELAAKLAQQEAQFTAMSTRIQEMQESREINKSLGQTTADVAGAGFATAGSAIDLLRESAAQGAITKQVTQMQGNITEAGYKEQAASYSNMAAAAGMAASAEKRAATGDFIGAGIQVATGIAQLPVPA
jgi:hypothetical protein